MLTLVVGIALLGVSVYFFKDKIIQATVSQINQYLTTKIEVNPKIEVSIFEKFPNLSIKFKDVKIYEHPTVGNSQLAFAEKLFFSFDIYNLIHSRYLIDEAYMENGFVHIKIDALGKVNYNILKPDTTSKATAAVGFQLNKIGLTNVDISYENIPGKQYHEIFFKNAKAKLTAKDNNYDVTLQTSATIRNIQIENKNFFQNKEIETELGFNLNTQSGLITIRPTELEVEKANFHLQGTISYLKPRQVDLKIEEKNGSIQTLLSLIPEEFGRELRAYQSEGEVFLSAIIKGEVRNNQNPLVEVNFGFRNTIFYHPDLKKKITKANLNGYFTNGHQRRSQTSTLRLDNISCMMDGHAMKGNLDIRNFLDPTLQCNLSGMLDVQFLFDFYPVKEIEHVSGLLDINARFKGRIADLKKSKTSSNVNAEGEISLLNISMKHARLPYQIENVKADILFNNNDISVSNFSGKAGRSDVAFDGFFKNAMGNLIFHSSPMYVEGELKSDYLDVDELLITNNIKENVTSPQLLSSAQSTTSKNAFENIMCKINCKVSHLKFKKIHARAISADITYRANELYMSEAKFSCVGGQVNSSCNLIFNKNKTIEARTVSQLTNINIDSLFYVFDDFGQTFITQKIIKGELSGIIDALFTLDKNLNIVSKDAIANIDVQILNGALNNFEPLKALSKFVEEKKLERIQFSELHNKIFIEDGVVHIPEMTIKSNVSELNISGTHTFEQAIDYRLTLPLKNLKPAKRDSDEAFGAIAPDKRGEPRLFLTIKGTAENYKIAYDKQRTQSKIKEDLKKEKEEFLQIFKKKDQEKLKEEKPITEQQYFDFGD